MRSNITGWAEANSQAAGSNQLAVRARIYSTTVVAPAYVISWSLLTPPWNRTELSFNRIDFPGTSAGTSRLVGMHYQNSRKTWCH